jgi:hypothetical protein
MIVWRFVTRVPIDGVFLFSFRVFTQMTQIPTKTPYDCVGFCDPCVELMGFLLFHDFITPAFTQMTQRPTKHRMIVWRFVMAVEGGIST